MNGKKSRISSFLALLDIADIKNACVKFIEKSFNKQFVEINKELCMYGLLRVGDINLERTAEEGVDGCVWLKVNCMRNML